MSKAFKCDSCEQLRASGHDNGPDSPIKVSIQGSGWSSHTLDICRTCAAELLALWKARRSQA